MFKVATNPDGSIMLLQDALEAGYTYGDLKFFRGYRSRLIVASEQTVLIAQGTRSGELFVELPSYRSTRYFVRQYLVPPTEVQG